eukprot:m.15279 g.15279  ORF g.15279 m.15279 type:complete len:62 (+) comp4985_c0_seq1:748-933(+)
MQMGATFVVDKGGNILFSHVQQHYGDHPELDDILAALDGRSDAAGAAASAGASASATTDEL